MRGKKVLFSILSLLIMFQLIIAKIPKPEDHLGFKIGTERKLASRSQIIDYFLKLGKSSSRVFVEEVGKTTMGNPFILAVITSENNHKNLEQFQKYQQLLADPRIISEFQANKIIQKSKTIVMINCSLHATEIGASQMSMRLAYDLATKRDKSTLDILNNVILLLVPMHNPDGIQMVVDWYQKNLGSKWEGGRMPWLYHKYVGHDNNRDWYMFTQKESRLTIKIHNRWHPQIILDMHQMGSRGARLFVPPYVDPYEPNVDPILRQQVASMGTFIATQLTAEKKGGVLHSSIFDAWTPGRAYHHYHGGIRILTEAASVKIATPITVKFDQLYPSVQKASVKMPLVWKGGKWTLKDIVDYDYSAARAALIHAAGLRDSWLRNFYRIQEKAVSWTGSPFAFVIPAQQKNMPAAVNMLNTLRIGDVEIHRSKRSFWADGYQYPSGSYIVYVKQPFGRFAKALLEKQVYPEIREYADAPLKTPYDVVAHTLPLLMGVESIQVEKPFKVDIEKINIIAKPRGTIDSKDAKFGYTWGHKTNDDIMALNRLTKKGYLVYWAAEGYSLNGEMVDPGKMIVVKKDGLLDDLTSIIGDLYVKFSTLNSKPKIDVLELKPVRLGLYKSWTASMDEGWTRWVLEKYEIPYKSIHDKDIRKGNLNQELDVIIIPDLREKSIVMGHSEKAVPPKYAGGIGDIGVKNIRSFIENGGTLITLNRAADFPLKRFYLNIRNCVDGIDRKEFFIPGSILKALNKKNHPITYGYGRDVDIFFRRSPVFDVREGVSVVTYPVHNPLQSGWLNGEKYLFGRSAIVDVPFGTGKIILLGFPVQYRGQTQETFRFLFNSIYYGPAIKNTWK